eukprot:TRINITY_DN792_c0_g3_i1.p1 TRINITY_DN792_c0_g3~~TRINITY_DN792_c0_g3_i1.p1  ORF type:complete len:588 (-),score=90.30 TRINITY_DN792_c0_g3_i1:228-1991(-)
MLALGQQHGLAFTDGEVVVGWGDNRRGHLGDGTRQQRAVPGKCFAADLCQIATGMYHSLALTQAAELLVWGGNDFGQLGDGTNMARGSPVELKLPGNSRACKISAGWWHTLVVTEDGDLFAWGQNVMGQLGDGSTENRRSPVLTAAKICHADAGWLHSCAVTVSGGVLAWGSNACTQLAGSLDPGPGSLRLEPEEVVPAGSGAKAVSCGYAHTIFLTDAGEVFAWGKNDRGQLGNGSLTDSQLPVQVNIVSASSARVCAVASGYNHCVALTQAGEVITWGANELGQLGDSTNLDRSTPVKVFQQDDLCGVAAGWNHTACWASEIGEVWAWGANHCMQVGNGSKEHALSPVCILADFPLQVHPFYFAVTLQQFESLHDQAVSHFGGQYRLTTTRDVVDEIVRPFTASVANQGYARILNKGNLLSAEAFVSHCWAENFNLFTSSVDEVFCQYPEPPNLWICFLALSQSGKVRSARRPGLRPDDAPFVQALRRCKTVLLVRNSEQDVYKRLWCIFEVHMSYKLGFMAKPGRFLVHGPQPPFCEDREVVLANCRAFEPEDQQWLLDFLSRDPAVVAEVQNISSEVNRTFFG